MESLRNSNNKRGNRKSKFSRFTPILAGTLFLMNPIGTSAQITSNENRTKAEVSTSTILDRLNQKLGILLPAEYSNKVLDFVLNDTIMRTRSATTYTEEFIVNEMQKDRGINKQSQLLFIRSSIYGGISQKFLYDRLDDDNEVRASEYEKALNKINKSYEEYKKGFKTYMETKSAEYDKRSTDAQQRSADAQQRSANAQQRSANAQQRSADAQQRSANAQQRSADAIKETMRLDSLGIKHMVEFYETYDRNPDIIEQNEINSMKESTKKVITQCKKYGIDYKAILLKNVGNKKKLDAILKFYDLE